MRIVIVLTCTVNTQPHINWLKQRDSSERLKMYLDIIIKWLINSKLQIVVIENSGIDLKNEISEHYPHFNINDYSDRFESISFSYNSIPIKDKHFLDAHEAKGHHELYAINYAHNNSKLIKECDYLIKITGRYFIPKLEIILIDKLINHCDKVKNHNNKVTSNINIIRQSQKWRGWNRCEVLGCHISNFDDLFKYPSHNDMLEEEYTDRINNLKKENYEYQIYDLPLLKLDKPTKQGVGTIIEKL